MVQHIFITAAGIVVRVIAPHPRPKKRDWQLGKTRDLILEHRSRSTPIDIVRNAVRQDELVKIAVLPTGLVRCRHAINPYSR